MSNLFQSLIKDCWAALNAYFNTQVGNFSILVIEAVIVFSNVSVLQCSRERSDELKAQGSLQARADPELWEDSLFPVPCGSEW